MRKYARPWRKLAKAVRSSENMHAVADALDRSPEVAMVANSKDKYMCAKKNTNICVPKTV